MRRLPAFADPEARLLLDELCRKRGIEPSLVHQLAEKWMNFSGAGRAHGVSGEIEFVLLEYMRERDSTEPSGG